MSTLFFYVILNEVIYPWDKEIYKKEVAYMGETCSQHDVCLEKIAQVQKEVDRVDKRVDSVQKDYDNLKNNVNIIDKNIEIRFATLENTNKLLNEMTNQKIDKLDKKFDKIIADKGEEPKKEDSFDIWLKKIGLKILEYSLYVALTLGVLKGFKIF